MRALALVLGAVLVSALVLIACHLPYGCDENLMCPNPDETCVECAYKPEVGTRCCVVLDAGAGDAGDAA